MESLLGALNAGSHSQYLDNPELLAEESTTEDGNLILGHVLGSNDASRAVAGRAAEQTVIGADVLKQMLPVLATMEMGGLSKQNATAPAEGQEAGRGGFLGSLVDQDRDGSVADDVAGLLGRFLGGR